ncbi:unnamed protein product [Urochloa humidicola]
MRTLTTQRLNGYENNSAYNIWKDRFHYGLVQWNLGVGPTSTFTRAMSSLMGEAMVKYIGPFDCIIKVDLKQSVALPWRMDIKEKLSIKVAEELGLLRQEDDEISYYSYGLEDATRSTGEQGGITSSSNQPKTDREEVPFSG